MLRTLLRTINRSIGLMQLIDHICIRINILRPAHPTAHLELVTKFLMRDRQYKWMPKDCKADTTLNASTMTREEDKNEALRDLNVKSELRGKTNVHKIVRASAVQCNGALKPYTKTRPAES